MLLLWSLKLQLVPSASEIRSGKLEFQSPEGALPRIPHSTQNACCMNILRMCIFTLFKSAPQFKGGLWQFSGDKPEFSWQQLKGTWFLHAKGIFAQPESYSFILLGSQTTDQIGLSSAF